MARGGLIGKVVDRLEEYTGYAVVEQTHLRVQEALAQEAWFLANDLEEIGYTSVNYRYGRPTEATATRRRWWAREARQVWQTDPVGGAAVEMLNEFSLGRGVPRPRAKEKQVQKVLDRFWDDPQNRRVLTTFAAQMKFGTSLSIQANVFFTAHESDDDPSIKLSFLNHDLVHGAYTDPANRQRVLFYLAQEPNDAWDWRTKTWLASPRQARLLYYEAWEGCEEALVALGMSEDEAKQTMDDYRAQVKAAQKARKQGEGKKPVSELPQATDPLAGGDPTQGDVTFSNDQPVLTSVGLELPPPNQVGEGLVYHISENLDMEMNFGIPRMRRTIRWLTSLNEFMAARVNMMMAAASFIGKQSMKGATAPGAFEKLAQKSMRAVSDLRSTVESVVDPNVQVGPRPASIAREAGNLQFEPFNLQSGSQAAEMDAQMLRGQISAGERWPQHYFGDASTANLAAATALELPVLKHVEARQEPIEAFFRWSFDRAIERAKDAHELEGPAEPEPPDDLIRTINANPEVEEAEVLVESVEMVWRIRGQDVLRPTRVVRYGDGAIGYDLLAQVDEAHEDKTKDEEDSGLSLDYEFAMPSPLRRLMGDIVTAAVQTAQMADPNGENVELTRVLLTIVLSEAFEVQDAPDVVARIFPPDYKPLSVQAAEQQIGGMGAMPGAGQGPPGANGGAPPRAGAAQQTPNFFSPDATSLPPDPGNAYGAPKRSRTPEQAMGVTEVAANGRLVVRSPSNGHGRNGADPDAAEIEREYLTLLAEGETDEADRLLRELTVLREALTAAEHVPPVT